ncbi:hypothetical protein [Streptomyces sp. NPDC101132]|uniref:hypothetical protein n=1 Tax=Streptomyces sp. NPDC101132 TaxID=3366110 RepID=UPI0037F63194
MEHRHAVALAGAVVAVGVSGVIAVAALTGQSPRAVEAEPPGVRPVVPTEPSPVPTVEVTRYVDMPAPPSGNVVRTVEVPARSDASVPRPDSSPRKPAVPRPPSKGDKGDREGKRDVHDENDEGEQGDKGKVADRGKRGKVGEAKRKGVKREDPEPVGPKPAKRFSASPGDRRTHGHGGKVDH